MDIKRLQEILNRVDVRALEEHQKHIQALQQLSYFDQHQKMLGQIAQTSIHATNILHLNANSAFESDRLSALLGIRNQISAINEKALRESLQPTLKQYESLLEHTLRPNIEGILKTLSKTLESQVNILFPPAIQQLESLAKATSISYADSLAEIAKANNYLLESPSLLKQMADVCIEHSRFTNNTLSQLANSFDKKVTNALKGALLLANEQTINSASLMQSFFDTNESIKSLTPNLYFKSNIKLNRFRVQRYEFLSRENVDENDEYDDLIAKSSSANSYEKISNCIRLIALCNEASETTSGEPIFKITSTFLLSISNLLNTVTNNRDTLILVVQCLYLILYEAAGKDKLRFQIKNYVTDTECEVVWKIKHLRNKWLSHDADHGKERDIKKSWQSRAEALQWFGIDGMPTKTDDYIFLHNCLLSKVEEFLTLLLERVSKFPK